jgi:DNA-binding transcriptional MerR regulator
MRDALTISALSKGTGVSSKTLRYWEGRRLLPVAARSHTGYRLFIPEAISYVRFIQKAKDLGFSLREIATVLRVSKNGGNPCPQVAQWAKQKAELVDRQIQLLTALRGRLRRFSQLCAKKMPCPRVGTTEICCLIEDLATPKSLKGGDQDAKAMVARRGGPGCAGA